jgi:hypothetical protein
MKRRFESKRDEIKGGWRTFLNREPHKLYYSLNIIRAIKSRRKRGAGHVAHMGDKWREYRFYVGKSEGKDHC